MSKNLFETQNFNSLKEALKDIKPSDSQSTDRSPVNQTLCEVYEAMRDKGYNPVNQLVGYIISGDPTYITSYKDLCPYACCALRCNNRRHCCSLSSSWESPSAHSRAAVSATDNPYLLLIL